MTPEKRQNDEMFIFGAYSFLGATCPSTRTSNTVSRVSPCANLPDSFFSSFPAPSYLLSAGSSSAANAPQESELYAGWLKMYDLQFDEAHRVFAAWKQSHPDDSLGPASNAAAYLFSELARLGALESELFVDDSRFKDRAKLRPDPARNALFVQEIAQAERLADAALQRSGADSNALFVKSMTLGLRADNAALIEKQSLAALSYTKEAASFPRDCYRRSLRLPTRTLVRVWRTIS